MSWFRYEELYMTGLGLAAAALTNVAVRRPVFSRLYMFPIYGGVGYGVGRILADFNSRRIAERELAIWDYVRRHPEDFPELSPKKFKDIIEDWNPAR